MEDYEGNCENWEIGIKKIKRCFVILDTVRMYLAIYLVIREETNLCPNIVVLYQMDG